MMALTRKGMNRQEAHELLRVLDEKEIEEALNPRSYLGTAIKQVELAKEKTKHEIV